MSRCHFILVFIPVWASKAYYSTSSIQWTDLWKIVSQERIVPKIVSAEYKQDTIKHCAQCATIYGFKCGSVLTLSHVRHFVTLWTVAHRAPLPMAMLQAGILEWADSPLMERT